MNEIEFKLQILKDKAQSEYEGITYSNCAFIKLLVDSIDLLDETEGRKGIIVWDELKKTKDLSGDFLIITCVCGVADDAGFDFIGVNRASKSVIWTFNDDTGIVWEFDKDDYDLKIGHLEKEIARLTVTLEPTSVVFPE